MLWEGVRKGASCCLGRGCLATMVWSHVWPRKGPRAPGPVSPPTFIRVLSSLLSQRREGKRGDE